jgi:hypothetical protein
MDNPEKLATNIRYTRRRPTQQNMCWTQITKIRQDSSKTTDKNVDAYFSVHDALLEWSSLVTLRVKILESKIM